MRNGTQLKNNENQKVSYQLKPNVEIPELCQLRDLYRRDWPKHCVGFYCIDNFIRWLRLESNIRDLHIFTFNGDGQTEGLCLIVDRYQLFVNSLSTLDNTKLEKALSLLDWSIGYKVSSVRLCHYEAVLNVIKDKNLSLEYNNATLMYFLPCQQALNLEINCPVGYELGALQIKDAKFIDDLWSNKHQGSLFLIKRLIEWNANKGIYSLESGELVAWCLRLQGGFLGSLQVKANYKGLGLGAAVAAATSRNIAEMGHDIMALVYESNHAARRMFEKLGFKIVDRCYWLKTFPTKAGFEWSDGI